MEALAQQFQEQQVKFALVYTKEPHANEGIYRNIDQPADYCQRQEYAERTKSELSINREILVDTMDGKVQQLYGGLPNMIYIIDPQGKVVYHDRWADATAVSRFLAGAAAKN